MKQIIEQCTDDLDGTIGATTQTIGLNGLVVEIDLSDANADALFSLLQPYLDAGRRIAGKRNTPPSRLTAVVSDTPSKVIRDWWRSNPQGLPTWQRNGMIPASVRLAWTEHLDGMRPKQKGGALR